MTNISEYMDLSANIKEEPAYDNEGINCEAMDSLALQYDPLFTKNESEMRKENSVAEDFHVKEEFSKVEEDPFNIEQEVVGFAVSFEERLINEVRSHIIIWDNRNENYKNRLKSDNAWNSIAQNLNKSKVEVKSKWRGLRDVFQKELRKVRKPQPGDPGSPNDLIYIGRWAYFKDMLFLKDVIKPRVTEDNFHQRKMNETCTEKQTWSQHSSYTPEESNQVFDISEEITQATDASKGSIQTPNGLGECIQEPDASGGSIQASRKSNLAPSISGGSIQLSKEAEQSSRKRKMTSDLTYFQLAMLEMEEKKIEAFKQKKTEDDDEDTLFLKSLVPFFKHLNPVQKLRLVSKFQILIADEIASSSPIAATHSQVHEPKYENSFVTSSEDVEPPEVVSYEYSDQ